MNITIKILEIMLEYFSEWAKEIDDNWDGYQAEFSKEYLVVYDAERNESAKIDYNNRRYDISGENLPIVKKLTDLVHHRS